MRSIPETYLAAAEPSWAKRISSWQLLGLLNLGAILSPRVFLSDVQLGDNVHIFESYRNKSKAGLYSQIVTLAQHGVVRALLRDRTIRPQMNKAIVEVNSFCDVYRSWTELDSQSAWINQEITSERRRFFEALDLNVKDSAIVRYRYGTVKERFMRDVRAAASSAAAAWFQRAMGPLTVEQRRSYDRILEREWFSLSDMYEFLQKTGNGDVGLSSLLAHGLINESACSREVGAHFTGFDTGFDSTEAAVWGDVSEARNAHAGEVSRGDLLERASAVITVPSLSLIAMLTPDEIIAIRRLGRGYFEFAEHFGRIDSGSDNVERRFVHATAQYWEGICDYISRHHSSVSQEPSRMALYLRDLPWPLSHLGQDVFRFGLSLAQEPSIGGSTSLGMIARAAQFIFLADGDQMKQLHEVLPRNAWTKVKLPGLSSLNA